jgi:hypothetical protein
MNGITNKTDNEDSGMDLLWEPLLEVQPGKRGWDSQSNDVLWK